MIPALDVLTRLLIAHLIGDFILQPRSWVAQRNRLHFRSPLLYIHSAVHALLALIAVQDSSQLHIPAFIFITHLLIDLFKSYQENHQTRWFIVDQVLHLAVICGLWKWSFAAGYDLSLTGYFDNTRILATGLAILFLTTPTAIFIGIATRRWRKTVEDDKRQTLKDAGRWIGIIERILIFIFIVANQYQAVGFLLAAKSVFRFGDLRNTEEKNQTEYLMIGTLLSFGIAVMAGIMVRGLIL